MTALFTPKKKKIDTAVVTKKPVATIAPSTVSVEKKEMGATLANVLVRPHISEKATDLGAHGQYMFVVHSSATKIDVKRAFAAVYGVKPTHVTTMQVVGKGIQYGRTKGKRRNWKKAIITVPKGKTIHVYEGV